MQEVTARAIAWESFGKGIERPVLLPHREREREQSQLQGELAMLHGYARVLIWELQTLRAYIHQSSVLANITKQLYFFSLISFLNTSKHNQTPSNILDYHLFSTIIKVVFLHPILLSLVPYLGFEVQGCGCSFLATIHPLFLLQLFLALSCLIICFYCFCQHVLASQHVFIVFLACFLAYAMIYRFDVVGLVFLGQDMSKFSTYAQIYMPMCSLPCLSLDLHAYVLFAMFLLRSTCQCLNLCPYAQIYVYICFVPCLCAQIYVVCYAMRYFSPYYPLISFFLAFWPF